MSKKTLFDKVFDLLDGTEGKSPEEIDREVTAAVEAIEAEKLQTLEAEKIIHGGDGQTGGNVYIMDLKPLYEMIGGREGRLAEFLRTHCQMNFDKFSVKDRDVARRESELFVMRFGTINDEESFALAATIVNATGRELLGSQFETMDVPLLVVVTPAASAFNPDGSPNLEAMRAAVKDGGITVAMDIPDDDAPQWVKLRWEREERNIQVLALKAQAKTETAQPPARDRNIWSKRKVDERRTRMIRYRGNDKRKTFERRGRGY